MYVKKTRVDINKGDGEKVKGGGWIWGMEISAGIYEYIYKYDAT